MNILVTGGAGYIGSHACKRLLAEGHSVAVVDNLFRGNERAVDRLRTIPGVTSARFAFYRGDVADKPLIDRVLAQHTIEGVLHFAALAYVRESVDQPMAYYRANTAAAVPLLEACREARVSRFVLSSTCATYGEAPRELIPIKETCPQKPINPYGWSKLFIEQMLKDDLAVRMREGNPCGVAMLRYFNVAGCDRSSLIGEHHQPETHIIPIMLQVALGQREAFTLLGDDHPTPDGTCVRDYIHVEDLVDAHLTVLNALKPGDLRAYNLGIGRGYSIREVLASVEKVTGKKIPLKPAPRHPGDPATLFCDPGLIERELGWRASIRSIDEIVQTAWNWFKANPKGYH